MQADFSLLLMGKIRVLMHNTHPASDECCQMLALHKLDCYIESSRYNKITIFNLGFIIKFFLKKV